MLRLTRKLGRRLTAALVAVALAMPVPALAAKACPMSGKPALQEKLCHCCKPAENKAHCAKPAATPSFQCGCATDAAREPRQSSPSSSASGTLSQPVLTEALLPPASVAPILDADRVVPVHIPAPYASTHRTLLCSWII